MKPKNNKRKHLEGNVVVFEDLGIYNSDPEKVKKINDELKSFLKSIGCKPAQITMKEVSAYRINPGIPIPARLSL